MTIPLPRQQNNPGNSTSSSNPSSQQEIPAAAIKAAAHVSEKEKQEMAQYTWMIAKVIKAGFDGLPTLIYRDEWIGNAPGKPWDGFVNEQIYKDLLYILQVRALREVYPARGILPPPTPAAVPGNMLPVATLTDMCDVLEQYADNLEVEILEAAFADMSGPLKGITAFGKTLIQTMLSRKKALKDSLTFNTEEITKGCIIAASQVPKYREEMLPLAEIVLSHPHLLAWVCKFIRRFFKLEAAYYQALAAAAAAAEKAASATSGP